MEYKFQETIVIKSVMTDLSHLTLPKENLGTGYFQKFLQINTG